jgi:hypothetical protein
MSNLQDRLGEFKKTFESGVPPYNAPHEAIEMMHRATAELKASGIEGAALKVREVMNREEKNTHQEEIAHPAKAEPGVRRGTRATRGERVMNSGVRIIKRGRDDGPKSLQLGRDQKTERQSEREIAGTVKSWIADWEQKRNLRESVYRDMLIRFAQ